MGPLGLWRQRRRFNAWFSHFGCSWRDYQQLISRLTPSQWRFMDRVVRFCQAQRQAA